MTSSKKNTAAAGHHHHFFQFIQKFTEMTLNKTKKQIVHTHKVHECGSRYRCAAGAGAAVYLKKNMRITTLQQTFSP